MKGCPTDSILQQIIADSLPPSEQAAMDEHLSDCQRCRARMESISQVTELSAVLSGISSRPLSESFHLKRVMEQLQSEPVDDVTSLSTPSNWKREKETLPSLQPTMLPGYLGRLGNIQIRRVIGRGGMGVVFEGLDSVLNRTVAVKVLSPHLLQHQEAKNRFVREAQSAAALTHENVVAIHAINEADGMPFLVLQYIEGESLGERLQREQKLPVDEVVRIGIQVARGLAAAHDRGMVHRDVKPGNILLESSTGNARITDFGLAKHVGLASMTEVGKLAGTPAYMSPEQISDKAVDSRSDLFSLGVVFYQAVSGALPFQAETPFVLMNQISTLQEKPLRTLNPDLPAWFCEIVHRLLRKEPENRIASARELADLLERKVPLPVAAVPKKSNAARNVIVLVASLLIAGMILLAWYWNANGDRGLTQQTSADKPAISGFRVAGRDQVLATLAAAVEDAPDSGVIEAHGDGPFACSTIKIDGKRLTIRAAQGSHPRFIPDVGLDAGFFQFITTNADLNLEGLEIYWPLASPMSKMDAPIQRSVVLSSNNNLTVTHCRIISGPTTACIVSTGDDVTIENCHLSSREGSCLGWRVSNAPVRLVNNVLEARFIMHIDKPATTSSRVRKGIYLANNLLTAERMVNLIAENIAKNTFSMTACRNVIDCQELFILIALPKFPFNVTNSEVMKDSLQTAVAWTEESNIYRKRAIFLSSAKAGQLTNHFRSDLNKLELWLKFWKMESSGSVEGTVQYLPRNGSTELTSLQLNRIEAPNGTLPGEYGLQPGITVGPGAPYQLWLQTKQKSK